MGISGEEKKAVYLSHRFLLSKESSKPALTCTITNMSHEQCLEQTIYHCLLCSFRLGASEGDDVPGKGGTVGMLHVSNRIEC